ncbi:hypothetical protein [Wielerella bovis]|uniref:hypothetical protein n=1 Tax=Wielerella bovis TaxID=2917790 RepID=UPI002019FB3E|nr:hypothetical protein [Wielerella bovis]ULJ59753.1 hypothetical protein MIS44_08710 [Wielerella bovis]
MYLIEKGDVVRHMGLGKLMLVLADENENEEVGLRDLDGLEHVEPAFELVKLPKSDTDRLEFIQKMNGVNTSGSLNKENSNEH